jgi:S1-C subfamily serine protease
MIGCAAAGLALLSVSLFPATQTYADRLEHEERVIQAAEKTMRSTVKVTAKNYQDEQITATGFFVGKEEVLTTWNAVKSAKGELQVEFQDGRKCSAKAGYREESSDLAILKPSCEGVSLPLASKVRVAETVVIVGNPTDFDFSLTRGSVTRIMNSKIQVDARVNASSSGAPVVNANGEVVGVIAMKPKELDYLANAVTYKEVNGFMERARTFQK